MALATDVLERVLPHLHRFTPYEVGGAPERAGLYAWYGRLDAGTKDWAPELVQGTDLGIERILNVVRRHSSRFASPPLSVKASGRFVVSWSGEITSDATVLLQQRLAAITSAPTVEGEDPTGALRRSVFSPKLRGGLADLISLATPVLSSPLYVGVSHSLRGRLQTHVRDLERFSQAAAREPGARERLKEVGKNFACRAVGAGFTPDALEVWCLDVATLMTELSASESRTLVEAAEWLLNRWHRPPLGKR